LRKGAGPGSFLAPLCQATGPALSLLAETVPHSVLAVRSAYD